VLELVIVVEVVEVEDVVEVVAVLVGIATGPTPTSKTTLSASWSLPPPPKFWMASALPTLLKMLSTPPKTAPVKTLARLFCNSWMVTDEGFADVGLRPHDPHQLVRCGPSTTDAARVHC